MTFISELKVFGTSDEGMFSGTVSLGPGLNVLSARNSYGKSLALRSIPWCLGLEPMFGLPNGDPSLFPEACRRLVELDGKEHPVVWCSASIQVVRSDGSRLRITRPIAGADAEVVDVQAYQDGADEPTRELRLNARQRTMADETGGLQRYLFEWLDIPVQELIARNGSRGRLYLENLAPLFLIDQLEGWSDLQALQVRRYQLQDVDEAAVEYLLGATQALDARVRAQAGIAREAQLKGEATAISERIDELAKRNGWDLEWSARGSASQVATRWRKTPLKETLVKEFHLDFEKERSRLTERILALRKKLGAVPSSTPDLSAARAASQKVVELKALRHSVSEQLRDARTQLSTQNDLLASIEHRKSASEDVLRLKTLGIGQMRVLACPTCEQTVTPDALHLTPQSVGALEAHISALAKQRELVLANSSALEGEVLRLAHNSNRIERELGAAERGLDAVNSASGPERERLAKVATDLAAAERESGELTTLRETVDSLESDIQAWTRKVDEVESEVKADGDKRRRVSVFAGLLADRLRDLGHTALSGQAEHQVSLDERYVPMLDGRRLRGLGSASDHPRLVAAYTLALAQASAQLDGYHPGFVVLDEPQQQHPDRKHEEMLMEFLSTHASESSFQTIVATSLEDDEVAALQKAGVGVSQLEGPSFLRAVPIS
jgi:hypothetical protein